MLEDQSEVAEDDSPSHVLSDSLPLNKEGEENMVTRRQSLTFLYQEILSGLGLELTSHSRYTSSPSLTSSSLMEGPRESLAELMKWTLRELVASMEESSSPGTSAVQEIVLPWWWGSARREMVLVVMFWSLLVSSLVWRTLIKLSPSLQEMEGGGLEPTARHSKEYLSPDRRLCLTPLSSTLSGPTAT